MKKLIAILAMFFILSVVSIAELFASDNLRCDDIVVSFYDQNGVLTHNYYSAPISYFFPVGCYDECGPEDKRPYFNPFTQLLRAMGLVRVTCLNPPIIDDPDDNEIYISSNRLVVNNVSQYFMSGSGEFGIVGDFNNWDFSDREGYMVGDSLVVDLEDLPLKVGANRMHIVQGGTDFDSASWISVSHLSLTDQEWFRITDVTSEYGAGDQVLAIYYDGTTYSKVPEDAPVLAGNDDPPIIDDPDDNEIYISSDRLVVNNVSQYFMSGSGEFGIVGDFNNWDFSNREGYMVGDNLVIDLEDLPLKVGANRMHIVQGGTDFNSASWISVSHLSLSDQEWFRITDATSEYGAGDQVLAIYYDGTGYSKVPEDVPVVAGNDDPPIIDDPDDNEIYISSNRLVVNNVSQYFMSGSGQFGVVGDFNNWDFSDREGYMVGDNLVIDLEDLPLKVGANRMHIVQGGTDFNSASWISVSHLSLSDQEWFRITDATSEYGAGDQVLAIYYDGTGYSKVPSGMPVIASGD